MLTMKYKNERGEVILAGGGSSVFRVTAAEGLGLCEKDCQTVIYAGYDGQETVSSRYAARCITVSGDISSSAAAEELRRAADVLCGEGYLYVLDGDMRRRIYCKSTVFPDVGLILRGRLASFAVQFMCDSPFFEDAEDMVAAVYARLKNIAKPFTLPCMFGETVTGADVTVRTRRGVEPCVRIYCAKTLENAETLKIENETTGKSLTFTHTPTAGETIVIDVKGRTAESSVSGSIIGSLTDDSYLNEFRLEYGTNRITAEIGGVSLGLTVECVYNNCYEEAMII